MNPTIINVGQINTNTEEGKLLLAALAILTTKNYTNKTPEQVIEKLYHLSYQMFSTE